MSLKIIDAERKGNLVRFYMGEQECQDYHGDDWDDVPYEHNAGEVYPQYVVKTVDVAFPYDASVLEPADGTSNSCYSKDDMKERKVPCLIVIPDEFIDDSTCWYRNNFARMLGNDHAIKFYFGDGLEVLESGDIEIIPVARSAKVRL